MTEWDAAIDDPTPGQSGMAFLALVTGLAWLVCAPFDLLASIRKRGGAKSDDGCEGADWGREVPNYIHNDNAGAA
jgi:hypothetical protein